MDTVEGFDARVIQCLQDYHDELEKPECRTEVHRLTKRAAEDIRFDEPLADACYEGPRQVLQRRAAGEELCGRWPLPTIMSKNTTDASCRRASWRPPSGGHRHPWRNVRGRSAKTVRAAAVEHQRSKRMSRRRCPFELRRLLMYHSFRGKQPRELSIAWHVCARRAPRA